ncbi:MAG: acetyl-CoA carboxylase carboxyl transferase subunit beta [Chloroflexi bacterium]|nr:acetyl-CoA carboxylase carboxyl transferase subunit beta [Chloroflexota bacterium]
MVSLFTEVKKTRPARFFGEAVAWITRWTTRLRPSQAVRCRRCGRDLFHAPKYRQARICDFCGYNFPLSARARIQALADSATFVEFTPARRAIRPPRTFYLRPGYRASRQREAIVVGTAQIAQQAVVIAAFDFRVFGGSMSVAVGEAMARSFEHAARQQLPLVAIIASGGVRIQEGLSALLQMAKTVVAAQEFQRAHRPFIAVLTNPTTGGVYASFASLADILLAEPGALIGFAGPRIAQVATGLTLPAGSHTAESALQNGMLDAIVPREELRERIAKLLALASPPSPSLPSSPILSNCTATDCSAMIRPSWVDWHDSRISRLL